jgi:hypothetical protein
VKRDDVMLFLLAILLGALACVGIWLVVDSTLTGQIVRWPI